MKRLFPCVFAVVIFCCNAVSQTPQTSPAGTDQPGVTSTVSTEVAQFQIVEDKWSDAVNRHDQYALELVLSPLFVDVAASGDVTTRNQQVAQSIGNDDKSLNLTQKVITVRMLGDVAVVNGTYTLHHRVNTTPVDEKGVFTQVFERVHGGWLCINSQRTLLRQEVSKKKGPPTAEAPFHFPIFSKGDKGPQ